MSKPQMICTCPAYRFPHRYGGGACVKPFYTCAKCGQVCEAVEKSELEAYEFWGERGTHIWHFLESDCCDAPVDDVHVYSKP